MRLCFCVIFFVFLIFAANSVSAQAPEKKNLKAIHVPDNIKIDGLLDEQDWATAPFASDFVEQDPVAGEASAFQTRVRVLYTDFGIYIGAEMLETNPDSISSQFNLRDQFDNTDNFTVILDCFRDGTNGYGFGVSTVGVQYDAKFTVEGSDNNIDRGWDAVWRVKTTRNEKGWVAEFEIPYSALRFSGGKTDQIWHINFKRFQNRSRETSYWNEINPAIPGVINQSGLLSGISNVQPPLRIQAFPFVSNTVQNYYDPQGAPKSAWGNTFNGGMDVKVGLSDAFTLDMTLVPDFGQVRFDNRVLNLSPFEIRFDENRPFFTEGAEIFNKGNQFYSRRIGGAPIRYDSAYKNLAAGETVVNNPATQQLYNATKISGRTSKKTGIGFFNALAAPTEATIRHQNGQTRKVQTSTLTNYNVLVIDQTLRNNSNFFAMNTHVFREGDDYDALCTSAGTTLRDKKNNWAFNGSAAISQKLYIDSTDRGHNYNIGFERTGGQWTGGANYYVESYNYDPNDLGFLMSPNEKNAVVYGQYSIFEPWKRWIDLNVESYANYVRTDVPDDFSSFEFGASTFLLTKKIFAYGTSFFVLPYGEHDYFEPRTEDFSRFYNVPRSFGGDAFISTDYRKPVAIDVSVEYNFFDELARRTLAFRVSPRIRPSSKLFSVFNINIEKQYSDIGYITPSSQSVGYAQLPSDAIVFGRRDWLTVINDISGQYTFNNTMGLTLRLRHYWAQVNYKGFEELQSDGNTKQSVYTGRSESGADLQSTNFNIFNIDLVYQWRFAPGSDLFITWKNNIFTGNEEINSNYYRNLTGVVGLPQSNSLQVKCIYFLDYAMLRRWANRNNS